jgi:anti-anti-sigma factor
MAFNASYRVNNGTVIIALEGDLDALSAPVFQENVDQSVGPDLNRLVLDMSKLDYISSAGLRQIIYARQKMNDDVRVVLVGANQRVTETIKLVGFDQSVTFSDQLPED